MVAKNLMSNEMPAISATSYSSSTVDTASFFTGANLNAPSAPLQGSITSNSILSRTEARRIQSPFEKTLVEVYDQSPTTAHITFPEKIMSTIRIVKVFIADPNENLPLDKRLMYSGSEQLTDLTDQELFFEVPIAELLKAHNTMRLTTVDKKQTEKFGRDVFLEPVRIRDLKMVVVAVAAF